MNDGNPTIQPKPVKTCQDCGGPFTTPGRLCRKCYKRRSRRNINTHKCVCGKTLTEGSLVCRACWHAACRKALAEIKAKCGMRVEEVAEIPERYRSQYKEAE